MNENVNSTNYSNWNNDLTTAPGLTIKPTFPWTTVSTGTNKEPEKVIKGEIILSNVELDRNTIDGIVTAALNKGVTLTLENVTSKVTEKEVELIEDNLSIKDIVEDPLDQVITEDVPLTPYNNSLIQDSPVSKEREYLDIIEGLNNRCAILNNRLEQSKGLAALHLAEVNLKLLKEKQKNANLIVEDPLEALVYKEPQDEYPDNSYIEQLAKIEQERLEGIYSAETTNK